MNATDKIFEVYAVREERGAFLTQRRTVQIGTVRAVNMEQAAREVRRLFPDMSSAYAVGRMD